MATSISKVSKDVLAWTYQSRIWKVLCKTQFDWNLSRQDLEILYERKSWKLFYTCKKVVLDQLKFISHYGSRPDLSTPVKFHVMCSPHFRLWLKTRVRWFKTIARCFSKFYAPDGQNGSSRIGKTKQTSLAGSNSTRWSWRFMSLDQSPIRCSVSWQRQQLSVEKHCTDRGCALTYI